MQRFQVPYSLKKIPEVQEYLRMAFENSKHHGDLQDLYRRRFVRLRDLPCISAELVVAACLLSPSNRLIHLRVICGNCLTGRRVRRRSPHLTSIAFHFTFRQIRSVLDDIVIVCLFLFYTCIHPLHFLETFFVVCFVFSRTHGNPLIISSFDPAIRSGIV